MIKFKKSEIEKVAKIITFDSELFGDETMMVIAQLVELSETANKYGCKITDSIADGWGTMSRLLLCLTNIGIAGAFKEEYYG